MTYKTEAYLHFVILQTCELEELYVAGDDKGPAEAYKNHIR